MHPTHPTDAPVGKVFAEPQASRRMYIGTPGKSRRLTGRQSLLSGRTCTLLALLLAGLASLLGPSSPAWAMADPRADGYVYVLNNDLSGSNSITVFARDEAGSVSLLGTTAIGGRGSLAAFADGTQGSLIRMNSEALVFRTYGYLALVF